MDQADDGPDLERAHALEALVAPGEVELVGTARRVALPQHGVAQGLDPEAREQVEVVDASLVAGADRLVEDVIADAVDGAFVPAPEL